MAATAGRQRRMILLYFFVAIPLIVLLLFFLNPSFNAKATGYVKDIAGKIGQYAPAAGVPIEASTEGPVKPVIPAANGDEQPQEETAADNEEHVSVPDIPTEGDVPEQQQAEPDIVTTDDGHGLHDKPDLPSEEDVQAAVTSMSAALATPARSQALAAASQASSDLKASATPTPTDQEDEDSQAASEASAASSDPAWNEEKWWFQGDLEDSEYPLPKFDIAKLRYMAPHNYEGAGHETFATYYATRNATVHDPYFLSALQIVYRVLWGEKSKSRHPVTVFVPPFISDEQRHYFSAAGAIVRELNLLPFVPDGQTVGRWKDQFSKLEMWKQTDYSRIVYLDSDVFPLNNTDGIFNDAPEQTCNQDKLDAQDKQYASTLCNYVFSAAYQFEQEWTLNAGVMVFKPDNAMYDHLIRRMKSKKGWDTKMMEQGMLNYVYRKDGPFPINLLDAKWNAAPTWREDGKGWGYHYIHDKMWGHFFPPGDWVLQEYKQTWTDMLKLYESDVFLKMRQEDQRKSLEASGQQTDTSNEDV